jgi:hypothetical protein
MQVKSRWIYSLVIVLGLSYNIQAMENIHYNAHWVYQQTTAPKLACMGFLSIIFLYIYLLKQHRTLSKLLETNSAHEGTVNLLAQEISTLNENYTVLKSEKNAQDEQLNELLDEMPDFLKKITTLFAEKKIWVLFLTL